MQQFQIKGDRHIWLYIAFLSFKGQLNKLEFKAILEKFVLLCIFPFLHVMGISYCNYCSAGPPFQTQGAAKDGNAQQSFTSKSDVPAAPINTDVGGKASLQPKRTPVSDKEIEAIMVSKLYF